MVIGLWSKERVSSVHIPISSRRDRLADLHPAEEGRWHRRAHLEPGTLDDPLMRYVAAGQIVCSAFFCFEERLVEAIRGEELDTEAISSTPYL